MLESLLCLLGIGACVFAIVALQIFALVRAIRRNDKWGIIFALLPLLLTAATVFLIFLANRLHGC